ncbi:MAG: tRNA pseudouridine(55) synthase TruB [Acidobacteria bacterium]|nr:tRNA pseudouridine(55) synthase TruB [Acidobacteriota bacterium]
MNPGLHLAHKPVGRTSFSLVRAFQAEAAAAGGRPLRVCHGGTLDPFAEGLLLVLIGQATRLMDLHHPIPKHYEAEVVWGEETDNGDPLGRVVARGDPAALGPAALDLALQAFIGWHDQVPPETCAKKIGGEPAYRKVHRGETVVLPPCRVYLHAARWLGHDLPRSSRLELVCRGGFYVRALARDLGRALGCGAHLRRLRRTRIGPYADPGPEGAAPVSGEGLLPWCASRALADDELGHLRRGRGIPRGPVAPPAWRPPPGFPDPAAPVRAFHRGRLVALLREENDDLHPTTLLPGGL